TSELKSKEETIDSHKNDMQRLVEDLDEEQWNSHTKQMTIDQLKRELDMDRETLVNKETEIERMSAKRSEGDQGDIDRLEKELANEKERTSLKQMEIEGLKETCGMTSTLQAEIKVLKEKLEVATKAEFEGDQLISKLDRELANKRDEMARLKNEQAKEKMRIQEEVEQLL